jgi:hypothetical protein
MENMLRSFLILSRHSLVYLSSALMSVRFCCFDSPFAFASIPLHSSNVQVVDAMLSGLDGDDLPDISTALASHHSTSARASVSSSASASALATVSSSAVRAARARKATTATTHADFASPQQQQHSHAFLDPLNALQSGVRSSTRFLALRFCWLPLRNVSVALISLTLSLSLTHMPDAKPIIPLLLSLVPFLPGGLWSAARVAAHSARVDGRHRCGQRKRGGFE